MMSKENNTETGSGGGQDDCPTRDFIEKRRELWSWNAFHNWDRYLEHADELFVPLSLLVTVPEVFAKLNSVQVSSRF